MKSNLVNKEEWNSFTEPFRCVLRTLGELPYLTDTDISHLLKTELDKLGVTDKVEWVKIWKSRMGI